MKRLLICTVLIVAGIELGGMALDAFYESVNADMAAFQQNVNEQGEY